MTKVAFERNLNASVDAMNDCIEELGAWLRSQGAGLKATYTLELAAEELLNNVRMHGLGDVESPPPIELRVTRTDDGFEMLLVDPGTEFDPTAHEPTEQPSNILESQLGGLGLQMIRKRVESFDYERRDGRNFVRISIQDS